MEANLYFVSGIHLTGFSQDIQGRELSNDAISPFKNRKGTEGIELSNDPPDLLFFDLDPMTN